MEHNPEYVFKYYMVSPEGEVEIPRHVYIDYKASEIEYGTFAEAKVESRLCPNNH